MDDSPDSRARQLGAFLRAHRERLAPEVAGRRRRTPGLRREEVAQRAAVSAVWYMRIEQGRAAAVSADVLARLAGALELARAERAHLFRLGARHDAAAAAAAAADAGGVPAPLVAAVAAFAGPAYLLDRCWQVRAANPAAIDLFGAWIAAPDANLLRYVLVDPAAPGRIVDWEARARRLLAEFRAEFGRRLHDPGMVALVAGLRRDSPHFDGWWDEQQVLEREGGHRGFDHPERGRIAYRQLTLVPAGEHDHMLVVLQPD